MKLLIYAGLTIGSLIGSWVGSFFDHGNWLGGWGLLLGVIGSFVGIWAGYKASQYI